MYRTDISRSNILWSSPQRCHPASTRRALCWYPAAVVSLPPGALRGRESGSHVSGQVDYRLARNAVVREFRRGRLSRLDVCDAHPELMRAAINVGRESREDCPICELAKIRLVSYVFGTRLAPSGVCVTSDQEMNKLARNSRDMVCYVVEVCPNCSWNHLARSFTVQPASRSQHSRVP